MSFHEVLFPADIAYGASGGPKFKTAVFTADSGYEQRTLDWKDVRAEYDVSHTVKRPEQRDELVNFFMCRRGMAYGFRFKDWNDFTLRQEVIGSGDGVATDYQITKRYTSDRGMGQSWTYDRKITKLAWGSLAGVTVGGLPATRSTAADWSDVAEDALAYRVDENTGLMTFRTAPLGFNYDGEATATPFVLTGPMTGFNATVNGAEAMCVDYSTGAIHLRGLGVQAGLRRLDLPTGTETFSKSDADIAFPSTDAADNQQVSSLVAAAGGFLYVRVGGDDRQVLYKLSGADYTIAASYGVAGPNAPVAGEIGRGGRLGAVSNDGSAVIVVDLAGSDHAYNVFSTADLSLIATPDYGPLTTAQIGPTAPYLDAGFAVALTAATGVEVWDDLGNLIVTLGAPGAQPVFVLWDAGGDPGVLVGWRSDATASATFHLTKFSVEQQAEAWSLRLPGLGLPSPQTPVSDRLVLVFGTRLHVIDTLVGTVATRACPAPTSIGQAYDATAAKIATFPSGGAGGLISTDVEGVALNDPEEVKIGYGEFHVPVRFDTDHLDISHDSYAISSWSGISLIEVRDWEEIGL